MVNENLLNWYSWYKWWCTNQLAFKKNIIHELNWFININYATYSRRNWDLFPYNLYSFASGLLKNNCREKQSNILKHCKLISILLTAKLFFLLYTRIYTPLNLNALLTGSFSMILLHDAFVKTIEIRFFMSAA